MKPIGFPLIAIGSLLLASAAAAATRPHYGGTLHVQIESGMRSLDPGDGSQSNGVAVGNVLGLLFDNLVVLNDRGQAQPALALSWQSEPGNQRWQFVLRPGVTFSDGTPLTPELVAASLLRANPNWKIAPQETAVVIQLDAASVSLPAEMALARNRIAKLDSGKALGTGPFISTEWDPGKKLGLTARDDYWAGRPFLDSVIIEMGKNFRDETIAYDLGQAQLIEIPSEEAHHATESREIRASRPVELVALLFASEAQSPEEVKQRQALAQSIDRDQLNRVVLQNSGEAAGGLLPNWLTGYEFLFPSAMDLTRAQQLRAEVPQARLWKLAFAADDTLARLIAERIVLNGGDAGLRLQLSNQGAPDIRLVRVPLASLDGFIALSRMAKSLQLPPPRFLGNTADDLYHAENAMLNSQRVIPLLYLRTAWVVSKTLRNWEDVPDGTWRLPDVWAAPGKP
ncbi:MAG TPA: ABC transporter substrate-binding protein [Terriglobales bacterium]|nr:ABC transporter substrate-binding protein [Terriglobales bacterium]